MGEPDESLVPRLTRADLTESQRPYEPVGTAREIFYSRAPEVIVHGPAGTGKSRAIIEKHHYQASKHPRMRILWVRKTRKSLTESALVTYEDEVLPEGSPIKKGAGRDHRTAYHYPNGSTIVPLGLDDDGADKVMSSQWDAIYIQEGIELSEEVVQKAGMRLRNGRGPYHQLIIDTNPGGPAHFLLKRMQEGIAQGIKSTHRDNPRLWDRFKGEWTPAGVDYLARLSTLKGHLKDRYLHGLWVATEGARWSYLDDQVHTFRFAERFPHGLPEGTVVIMGGDYGLRNPFCALWIALTRRPDHGIDAWVYRELYEAGLLATQQAQKVVQATGHNERIKQFGLDPAMWQEVKDVETGRKQPSPHELYRRVLSADPRFGGLLKGFNKSRSAGQTFLDRLFERGNGYPDLYIDVERCPNLWGELTGAVWDPRGLANKEDIDPECPDHAITALIYGTHDYLSLPSDEQLRGPNEVPQTEMIEAMREEIYDHDTRELERELARIL